MEKKKKIHELKLHETTKIISSVDGTPDTIVYYVTRVVSGWIYKSPVNLHIIFVPDN